ncbi:MAG: trehalose-phosphatase [Pseudomonadota bacterium]
MHTYKLSRSGARHMLPPPPLDISRHALFLDVDGTLVDIQERPELVLPEPDLTALLTRLGALLQGAIAILTGRTVLDTDRILERVVPCVAGVHGQECRINDVMVRESSLPESWLGARADLAQQLTVKELAPHIEDKGSALALHYRHAPEHASDVIKVVESVAGAHGLRAIHGKLVSELAPAGASKGIALKSLMECPPFVGRIPVAVGDDVTDEDAFAAANERGGMSILVGAPRPTAAMFVLPDSSSVRAWLKEALS